MSRNLHTLRLLEKLQRALLVVAGSLLLLFLATFFLWASDGWATLGWTPSDRADSLLGLVLSSGPTAAFGATLLALALSWSTRRARGPSLALLIVSGGLRLLLWWFYSLLPTC